MWAKQGVKMLGPTKLSAWLCMPLQKYDKQFIEHSYSAAAVKAVKTCEDLTDLA